MPEVKTSAGYYAKDGMDPVDLFIGQEGTLGVVAEMEMALVKSPEELFSCFAFFADDRASWNFARECKRLGPLSVEYLDRNSLNMLRKSRSDIPAYAKASIFFEAEAAKGCLEKVVETWEELLRKYNVSEDDAWAAMSERESEKFLELRHSIPSMVNEIIRARGTQKVSTDIAVPEERFIEMMNFYAESFDRRTLESVIFGHIGESHVHVNMMPRSAEEALEAKALTLEFVRKAVSLGGTVSAEHGIGKIKHAYLEELYGKRGVIEMARIKKALDPAWILGLDNIFSRELVKEV
jgi:D-lactate dehydrogenase (cytochrome)